MSKLKPYKFQRRGIRRMTDKFHGRAINADDVGLGKSVQALMAAVPYRHKKPIVVVCPASVKWGWEAEVHKWTKWRCWICEGRTPPKRKPISVPEVIIINWDILHHWEKFLFKLNPNVLILDEIHYMKNLGTNKHPVLRSRAARRLGRRIKYIYGLSGTPFENKPAELFPSLNTIRKDLFPAFVPFGNRFCDPQVSFYGVTYDGATRKKELNKLLKRELMVRRTRHQVRKDLPPLQRSIVPVELPRKDREQYKEAESNIIKWLFKHKPAKAFRALNAIHLSRMNHLLALISELKYDHVVQWIDNFLATTDQKLTVFGHHRDFLKKLHLHYKDKSVLVYGGVKGKKRQLAIDQFVADRRIRLFIGGIRACGEGINKLQHVCHTMLIAELIWVGLKLLQVEGRLDRLGQKDRVQINYLIAEDTVEALLCRAILRKQKNFKAIIDGKFKEKTEFDIFRSVVRQLEKKRRKKK